MLKSVMIAPAILILLLSLAPAQSPWTNTPTKLQLAQKSNSPVKEANRNAKLADAASINEDLVGLALDGKADKVAERVTAMRNTLSSLRPLLSNSAFDSLGRQVTEMEQAFSKRDLLATALASVEAYRIIENAMDAASRPSPVEVAMLDYSGFKLSILGAAPVANWAAISTTAKESDGAWSRNAGANWRRSSPARGCGFPGFTCSWTPGRSTVRASIARLASPMLQSRITAYSRWPPASTAYAPEPVARWCLVCRTRPCARNTMPPVKCAPIMSPAVGPIPCPGRF